MYARQVGDETLTFTVSGKLWKRSLVMQDLESKTFWSHLLGEAMEGKLKGTQLQQIPSQMTDWQSWRATHPETTVVAMSRTSKDFQKEFYRDPARFVLGLVDGGTAKAWPFDKLVATPVVNDQHADVPLVVLFDSASKTALAFDRRIADRTLTFGTRDGKVMDRETKSSWNGLTGTATTGPLAGTSLKPLPAIVSFTVAWKAFHPSSVIFTGQEEKSAQATPSNRPPSRSRGPSLAGAPEIGERLPDTILYNEDGKEIRLSDLKGGYSVVVFGCLT